MRAYFIGMLLIGYVLLAVGIALIVYFVERLSAASLTEMSMAVALGTQQFLWFATGITRFARQHLEERKGKCLLDERILLWSLAALIGLIWFVGQQRYPWMRGMIASVLVWIPFYCFYQSPRSQISSKKKGMIHNNKAS